MKLIYVTDLHGRCGHYKATLDVALREEAHAIVNGGDMLPHGSNLYKVQRRFVREFLKSWLLEVQSAGIQFMGMLGNDDVKTMDDELQKITDGSVRLFNLAGRRVDLGGYSFIGMNSVTDYPFTLKDRCREDTRGSGPCPVQRGPAFLSVGTGFRRVDDWEAYLRSVPSIDSELCLLPEADPDKAVYVIHEPPYGIELDVTARGATSDGRLIRGDSVGSRAVAAFLRRREPLASLHGHIHESPLVTGVWKTNVGRTVCVQPGQKESSLVYVVADLDRGTYDKIERLV